MAGGETGSEIIINNNQIPIINGLPDDIALACLARLPIKYHTLLKCVSKRWRDLVHSQHWHLYRKQNFLLQTLIFALCRDNFHQSCIYVLDPNSRTRRWKRIYGMPPPTLKRKGMGFEALGNKIYLLGGCTWSEDATQDVYCFDASMNMWTQAAPLSTARCYFASEVLSEKLYAVGGLVSQSSTPHSWNTYDPSTNTWQYFLDPKVFPETEESFVMDGKIYIRSNISPLTSAYASVYDPSNNTWQHVDADMASGWHGPAVVVDGTLYVLDQRSGVKLMMWQKDNREWLPVGRLSDLVARPPCRLVAVGKSIFVVGKGRRTVVIDVDNAGNMGRVMVSSSIPKLTSDDDDDAEVISLVLILIAKTIFLDNNEMPMTPIGHLGTFAASSMMADCPSPSKSKPLSDARGFGHKDICKILESQGGTDPVGINSQTLCYEIGFDEVDMCQAILIGEGAYGEIYLVKWRGTEVAAKTIRSSIASNQKVKNSFLKELGLWQRLRHPNIVQFLGVLKHPSRLIFLTEYLHNGSLYDILRKKGRLDPLTAVAYALDIARGMNYLHQHRPHAVIHRDLTPRNVLQDEAGRLKVTDFGLSKLSQEKDTQGYKMTGGTGSYRYMAPEVYRRESYGKSVDVFSFALIVHEMLQGGPSNRAETPEQVADKRAYEDSRPPLSSNIYPEPIRKLLRECWHKNPDCRPTFGEIILQLEMIQGSLKERKNMVTCQGCFIL
ncbi:hypothetical protein ACFE04_017847 [Oxalis oulophora]